VALAGDEGHRRELRAGLRERVRASGLGDGEALAGALEASYARMWQRWCKS